MDPPQIIPARAPCQLERLQNNARRTTGPNTAPKPAQAKDTMVKTELFGSRAMNIATTAIRRSVILSATMLSFLVSLSFRMLPRRSEETAEDVRYTMEEIKKLAPDSKTVHTLAVKRASRLKEEFEKYELTQTKEIEKMISITAK